jgi:hypothetical protein
VHCAWALAHVGEYAQAMHALPPSTLVAPSIKTIATLRHFHPLADVDLPPFVDDFHPNTDLVLDRKAFIYALTHSPHLSFGNPLGMVYELLLDYFVLHDFASGFDFFFEIRGHIACGHVLPLISHLLVALRLLALEKQARGVQPIAIGKVIYQLVTRTLAI